MREIKGGICIPSGFRAAGLHCGIKEKRPDLALVYSVVPAVVSGMFTTNKVKAAPVQLSIRKIRNHLGQAIIANSGNANACTGNKGFEDARKMTRMVAEELGIEEKYVLTASTGIIGQPLPIKVMEKGIRQICGKLSVEGGHQAAEAIMTTDKIVKEVAVETDIPRRGKGKVKIGGMIKGAGMISPNLATMLCFITTDACVTPDALDEALREAVNESFNQISIDGDMSTNDTVIVLANGKAGNAKIRTWRKKKKLRVKDENFIHFNEALKFVCTTLAKITVKDGEGVNKLVRIAVKGACFLKDARRVARAIAQSLLVKTALAGASPNWGRIMVAIGSVHGRINPSKVDVYFDGELVVKEGIGTEADETKLRKILKKDEINITVDLNDGHYQTEFWGCDLTEKYIKINKRYF